MAKGNTRRKKVPSALRMVLAANVRERAKVVFKNSTNLPAAIVKNSSDAKLERISLSHVKRILNGDRDDVDEKDKVSATLEQLDLLGVALDLDPYQLLLPAFDPQHPQEARRTVVADKEAMREAARAAVQEALADKPAKRRK